MRFLSMFLRFLTHLVGFLYILFKQEEEGLRNLKIFRILHIGALLQAIMWSYTTMALEFEDFEFDFGYEVKTHYRDSVDNQFPLILPPGATLRTVDPGENFEISTITLLSNVHYLDLLTLHAKVDFIDRYDRNSTSDDKDIDVDQLWLRLGHEIKHGRIPEDDNRNVYFKLGKFEKFERQNDRHLESYGLVSTAFNRFEDQGIELGLDITPNVYIKGSWTSGNPVFLRDPNALAGDNGTSALLRGDPELNSGIVVLYDAEVEDLEFNDDSMEYGLGLGYRYGNESATRTFDLFVYGYDRDLQREADLFGTHYGGDLDILDFRTIKVNGLDDDSKDEFGVSLWIYFDNISIFGQFVSQDIGGLDRKGWEVEISHKFYFPEIWTIFDYQFLADLTPVFRYSFLDPGFKGPPSFPAPSIFWEWEKIDVGFRIGLLPGLDFTLEYAVNEFERLGRDESNDEFLSTLRWRYIF